MHTCEAAEPWKLDQNGWNCLGNEGQEAEHSRGRPRGEAGLGVALWTVLALSGGSGVPCLECQERKQLRDGRNISQSWTAVPARQEVRGICR